MVIRFLVGKQLTGMRLGILGMGRIGRAVADRARAFGMKIHYYNRSKLEKNLDDGNDQNAIYISKYLHIYLQIFLQIFTHIFTNIYL